MDIKGFKIGDKVRQKNPECFSVGNRVLTILDLHCGDSYIAVWHEGMVGSYFPLKPCEIEHVPKIGEQLQFNFMSVTE